MLSVLYEDNHLIAINKPAGTLVQGDATGDEPLSERVKAYIKDKYHKPGAVFLGVVHRLDRPVSGVVIFARTSKALARMNALFQKRETEKTYWALVASPPTADAGNLVHWLIKDEAKNKTTAFKTEHPQGLRSELNYKVIKRLNNLFMIEVKPITGRPHQIRVQLASMYCPIVGDVKYGFPQANSDGNICLHARVLSFRHPVSQQPITITAPLPRTEFWNYFQ